MQLLLKKRPYHLPVTLQEENAIDSKYAKSAYELWLTWKKMRISGALFLPEILLFLTHTTHPILWTSEHLRKNSFWFYVSQITPFISDLHENQMRSPRNTKTLKPSIVTVSPHSGKYALQWALHWASFDRTALTDNIHVAAKIVWHSYRALSSKKDRVKNAPFRSYLW